MGRNIQQPLKGASKGYSLRESRQAGRRALMVVLALTAAFTAVEAAAGVLTGSLALLADAGHMLSDTAALAIALGASWYSTRPATMRMSWGYYRLEILAALLNGVLLVLLVAYIFWEAYHRLLTPPEVKSGPMLLVAALGLLVNLVSARFLFRQRRGSLNVQAAFLNVAGDALGSVGAITAALVMLATGWYLADPIVSIVIGLVILYGALRLLKSTTDVLMESTPAHIDLAGVREGLLRVAGVKEVHDLHVWTLTTGFTAMSGHIVVEKDARGVEEQQRLLLDLRERLKRNYRIDHATIQLETEHLPDEDEHFKGDPRCLA